MPATGKIVADTSVVVAALRRVPGLKEKLLAADELLVPLTVLGELEYGANLAGSTGRQREAVHSFMRSATLLLPTALTAAAYGRIKAGLKASGTPLPETMYGLPPTPLSTTCRWPPAMPTSPKCRS